ncbi:MAG: AEC family transporter, partial [Coprobacillus sp.]
MEAVLIKSFTFLSIVLLGYILKTKGFFKKEDSQLISKIVSRITLPCAVLSSAVQLTFTQVTIIVMVVAIVTDLIMGLVGKLTFAKKGNIERASAIINTSGYNVANVTIPFVQAFFPGVGMGYVCMFDIGNSIGWLGLTVAWGKAEADENARFSIKHLVNTLLHSIPFLTYILIFTLGVLKLSLPTPIASVVTTIGSANSFLVMLMIGM